MMTFDDFRTSVRIDLNPDEASEKTLSHFYQTRRTPRETVAFIRRTLKKTKISHQKARGLVTRTGWSLVMQGKEFPSKDGSCWVGSAGSYYYTRPNLRLAV